MVQTNENHLELSLDCMADIITVPNPSLQFSLLSDEPYVVVHCHVEEWHLSSANPVAFCGLLAAGDQTVMYSNNLHSQYVLVRVLVNNSYNFSLSSSSRSQKYHSLLVTLLTTRMTEGKDWHDKIVTKSTVLSHVRITDKKDLWPQLHQHWLMHSGSSLWSTVMTLSAVSADEGK